jgi:hypothetical protein
MRVSRDPRPSLALAAYTTPDHTPHVVGIVALGPLPGAGKPRAARVAAALESVGGLVVDRAPGEPLRLVGVLEAGEGLACARALIDDYLPRAQRASGVIARVLEPADLARPAPGERAA